MHRHDLTTPLVLRATLESRSSKWPARANRPNTQQTNSSFANTRLLGPIC